MKSSENKTDADKLDFFWDYNAARVLKARQGESGKKKNLDEYFEFLDEVKPGMRELRHTVIFDEPFTLV